MENTQNNNIQIQWWMLTMVIQEKMCFFHNDSRKFRKLKVFVTISQTCELRQEWVKPSTGLKRFVTAGPSNYVHVKIIYFTARTATITSIRNTSHLFLILCCDITTLSWTPLRWIETWREKYLDVKKLQMTHPVSCIWLATYNLVIGHKMLLPFMKQKWLKVVPYTP